MDHGALSPNGQGTWAGAFRLDGWTVEPALNRVTRGDESVHVRRQLIDLLVFLANRPGQVVSKDEIFKAVWPGQFVAESGLARCISQLRNVFHDDPREPRIIETIPTRGYRLLVAAQPVEAAAPAAALTARSSEESLRAPLDAGVRETQEQAPAAATPPAAPGVAPRRRAAWLWSGIGLGILVVAGVVAWRGFRTVPRAEHDAVLVSFDNRTGNAVFDDTLRLALVIQLEQSPYLRVVPDKKIRDGLVLMGRPADVPVTAAVASDLCQRVGASAVLTGSIAALGRGYVISLEGTECATGRNLVRRQVEVPRKEDVLAALGPLASEVRGTLGESVASIQRHDVPLVEASTASLEALKELSAGDAARSRGRDVEAVQAYQRAIEADPQFALAYGRLGVHLLSLARIGEAVEALKHAFALRERTSPGERHFITSYYYTRVLRNGFKAMTALEAWRDAYPKSTTAHISLGETYVVLGRFGDALAEGRAALRLDPTDTTAAAIVVDALSGLERPDEAMKVAEQEVSAGRGGVSAHLALLSIAFTRGDAQGVRREVDWAASNPAAESAFTTERAAMAVFGGRMHDASTLWRERAERAEARGDHALAALTFAGVAIHAAFVGSVAQVRELTTLALANPGTPETVVRAAFALALAGDTAAAEQRFGEYLRLPDVEEGSDPQFRAPTQALIDIQRGRPERAVDVLAGLKPFELGLARVPTYVRGLAYMRAGNPRAAAAEFDSITAHRGALGSALTYPLAWLQLGRARAAGGDRAGARQAYERFLGYWKDADPDLPVVVQARQEYAAITHQP